MVTRLVWSPLFAIFAVACQPAFDERASSIVAPSVLAVVSEPPEAKPGASVSMRALVVDSAGSYSSVPLDWAFCLIPRPVSELDDVTPACFAAEGEGIVPAGSGLAINVTLPTTGCRQFGPEVPDTKPGQPLGRPTDPDGTGGYYQPTRILIPEGGGKLLYSLAQTRLLCDLPNAARETLVSFRLRYQPNSNPVLSGVELVGSPPLRLQPAAVDAIGVRIHPGGTVLMRASWPVCADHPECASCGSPGIACPDSCESLPPCGGQEPFVLYDLSTHTLSDHHEVMRVSWFATAGTFKEDRTGREEADRALPYAENLWTAPTTRGKVHLWVVLRDNRGGAAFESYEFTVE